MRHGKRINHLSRKSGHRKAMLANMANSLILHKRIKTTLAKAKALRKYAEPVINRAKEDTTHSRRMAFRYLRDKEGVKELFSEVSQKIANRPGGYTRIIKLGNRLGDNAEMCYIELVDFNELMLKTGTSKAAAKPKTRRSRRGGSGKGNASNEKQADSAKTEAKEEAKPKAEVKPAEAKKEAPKKEEPKSEKKEDKKDGE